MLYASLRSLLHLRWYIVINNISVTENGSCASDDVVLCQVSKQLTIHKLPPVLILHFKRFDLNGPTVTKDNRYISFPDVLNVAPYCTNECIKVIVAYIVHKYV